MKRQVFILLVALLTMGRSAFAYDFSYTYQGKTLYYYILNGSAHVTYESSAGDGIPTYSYLAGDVVIPDSVEYSGITYAVTSIGQRAFSYCTGITSVTIPSSVTSIDQSAFSHCTGITSVTIPSSVTSIGGGAFLGCSGLTSVIIPDGVITIGPLAFGECYGLSSVTLGNSVTTIDIYAFYLCGLTSVTFPSSLITIGEGAFRGCRLQSVTIPDNVTSIGAYAFYQNGPAPVPYNNMLTSVMIGAGVASIGVYAFGNNANLTSISVAPGNTHYDSRNNCNALIKTDQNLLIQGSLLTDIPTTVTAIGDSAFYNLSLRDIPNGVTHIGNYAFAWCSNQTFGPTITIPASVTHIGNYAFAWSNLSSVTIPASVTHIGDRAFYECSALSSIAILDGVTHIGHFAFALCSNLSSPIAIPASVTSIGEGILAGCPISSIEVDSNNTHYDSRDNCNAIIETSTNTLIASCENTVIPNTVESIGNVAFAACIFLDSIIIPENVTTIGAWGFQQCDNLTSVVFGGNVTSIGDGAFSGCISLEAIKSKAVVAPALGMDVFEEVSPNIDVHIPCGSLASYDTAWSYFNGFIEEFSFSHQYSFTSSDETKGHVNVMTAPTCQMPQAVIYAEANPEYVFARWSDGNTDNPRTLVLTSDTAIMANFSTDVTPDLCMVSVQDNRNVVIWTKDQEVLQYNIYREEVTTDNYELVATVPYDSMSAWVDEGSRPMARSYRYKMTAVDMDGEESPFSDVHKTMHLRISHGMGSQWNLEWNEYVGAEFVSYMIYRGTSWDNLQMIGQMPVGDNTSFTDVNAPNGSVYYQVMVVKSSPCNITKSESMIYSNIATNGTLGIEEVIFETEDVRIYVESGRIVVEGATDEVHVYDMMGRLTQSFKQSSNQALPTGVYLVKIGDLPARRVVVLR